jgi:hypothetical protein
MKKPVMNRLFGIIKEPRKIFQLNSIYQRLKDDNLQRRRLISFKNRFDGQRCFLMGNGPSLNQMDLSLFKDEIVWGSNRCYLLYDRIVWRPKFYVAVDTRVVPDIADEINTIIDEEKDTSYFFFKGHKQCIVPKPNVFWTEMVYGDESKLPFSMFSTHPEKYLYSVATVTIAMLQLAVYMGFNPIYLIGCDTNYTISSTVKTDGEHGLISTDNNDANHFSPNYFGKGAKWHKPYVERMIWHYEQSKLACDKLGVQVFNATVGGKLEVFPRVNYLDLF